MAADGYGRRVDLGTAVIVRLTAQRNPMSPVEGVVVRILTDRALYKRRYVVECAGGYTVHVALDELQVVAW